MVPVHFPFQLSTEAQYRAAYAQSVENPEDFWAQIAEQFVWRRKWDRVLTWNFKDPQVEWFAGGTLNM